MSRILSVWIITILAVNANAQSLPLPRGTAPIFLEMSLREFVNITKAESEPCHECVRFEERFVLLKTKHIFSDMSIPDGADASFFRDKLYELSIGFEEKLVKAVTDFRVKFGPEKEHVDWSNDISAYIWEDARTRIEIHHGKNKKKAFALFFTDKALRRALEQQYDKDKQSNTSHK